MGLYSFVNISALLGDLSALPGVHRSGLALSFGGVDVKMQHCTIIVGIASVDATNAGFAGDIKPQFGK